jgi:hypothetical protein
MGVWTRRSDVDRVADHWNDVIHASQICGQGARWGTPSPIRLPASHLNALQAFLRAVRHVLGFFLSQWPLWLGAYYCPLVFFTNANFYGPQFPRRPLISAGLCFYRGHVQRRVAASMCRIPGFQALGASCLEAHQPTAVCTRRHCVRCLRTT